MLRLSLCRTSAFFTALFLSVALVGFSVSSDIDEATSEDEKILLTFDSRAAVQAVASNTLTCSTLLESGILEANSSTDDVYISCLGTDRHCMTVMGITLMGTPVVGPEPIIDP